MVNFAGFAYLIMLFEVSLVGLQSRSRDLVLIDKLGLYMPLYLFELAGTGMMLTGWWRMTNAPSNSGAVGLMTGASFLGGLRGLTLLIGAIYLMAAISARGLDGLRYLFNSFTAFWLAEVCLLVATFSAVPGVAIIGGEVPNRRLRQQAGWVTLIHQILAIVLLSLFAAAIYLVGMADLFGDLNRGAQFDPDDAPAMPRRTGGERTARSEPSDPRPIGMFFLFAMLMIQGAYTYLHASLYAAGQRAAERQPDPS